jgi:hypothetical protein
LFALLFGWPGVAHADQFAITGGTALGDDSGASLAVRGTDFWFSSFGSTTDELSNLGSVFCPYPCDPASVTFSARLSGFLGSGSAQVGETAYGDVDFEGFLDFRGGPTSIDTRSGGAGVVRGPFTFTGLFNGFLDGQQVFSRTTTGQGHASLRFLAGGANQGVSLTFTDDAAPVPEPATLVLFATGAAGIAVRRRRRSACT